MCICHDELSTTKQLIMSVDKRILRVLRRTVILVRVTSPYSHEYVHMCDF